MQFCFASMAVVGKLALARVPANALVFVRVAGGLLVFVTYGGLLGYSGYGPIRMLREVARADLLRLVACAFLGIAINQTLFVSGLARTTAVNASVLGTTIPGFALFFAMAFRSEPFRPARVVGLCIALAGALLLVGQAGFSFADEHLVGNLMIVANSLSYGLFLVLVRPLAVRLPPLCVVTLLFAFALPPVALLGCGPLLAKAPELQATDIFLLAFLVAVPTVASYGLNQHALMRADSSLVAVYIYLQPVLAAVGAALLLGERPTLRTGLSAAIIFLGVYVSTSVSTSRKV